MPLHGMYPAIRDRCRRPVEQKRCDVVRLSNLRVVENGAKESGH
jgi:hypothetical protein